MAVEKQVQRMYHNLRPYIPSMPIRLGTEPTSLEIPVVVIPPCPESHSKKPDYITYILLSQIFFLHIGEWMRRPSQIKKITEAPEESPFEKNLRQGSMYQFIVNNVFDMTPSLRPSQDHEFWRRYKPRLIVSLFVPRDPTLDPNCHRHHVKGATATYYIQNKPVVSMHHSS